MHNCERKPRIPRQQQQRVPRAHKGHYAVAGPAMTMFLVTILIHLIFINGRQNLKKNSAQKLERVSTLEASSGLQSPSMHILGGLQGWTLPRKTLSGFRCDPNSLNF